MSNNPGHGDWVQAEDPQTGRPYWVNTQTNETSWTPPGKASNSEKSATDNGDADEWIEAFDPTSQRKYYINKTTKRSTWTLPSLNQGASMEQFYRYVDKKGREQGPFSESKMRQWFEQGYFKPEVKCKCDTGAEWSTIGKLFGKDEDNADSEGEEHSVDTDQGENKQAAEISDTDALKAEIKKVNSEVTGVYRMTQLASKRADIAASGEEVNMKRGDLSIQEAGVFGGLTWCQRYFVLKGAKLSWFDDESHTNGKARGTLLLTPLTKAETADDGHDTANLFKVSGDGDEVLLQASRFFEAKSWMNSLKKSVNDMTGASHTDALEKMTAEAMEQVSKIRDLHSKLKGLIKTHKKDRDGEAKEQSDNPFAGSPRASAAIQGDDELAELLRKCMAIKQEIQEWENQASSTLHSSVNQVKLLTRKQSNASIGLGKPMEGFLTKRAMSGKNSWKKRYFVLRPSGSRTQPFVSLKYMEKKSSKKVKGTISLSAHTSVEVLDDIQGHSFAFEVHEGSDSLAVSAPDSATRDSWIDALKACIGLFTAATTSSTSVMGDHFASLLRHMNKAKALCTKLLTLNDELSESNKTYGTTQRLMR